MNIKAIVVKIDFVILLNFKLILLLVKFVLLWNYKRKRCFVPLAQTIISRSKVTAEKH
jgi:hypothetical protein